MKKTVIEYHKINENQIMVTAIENVADEEIIRENFGNVVTEAYLRISPKYISWGKGLELYDGDIYKFIGPETILTNEEFNRLIKTLKKAGENFEKCKKANTGPFYVEI